MNVGSFRRTIQRHAHRCLLDLGERCRMLDDPLTIASGEAWVRRVDRARLNAAVRELDKEALQIIRKAQADYLAGIDDGDGDDEEVGQTPKIDA